MNGFQKCAKLTLVLFIILSCYFCTKNKKHCLDYYKEGFNSIRDSVGLISFDDNWQVTHSTGTNNYWCNDSNQIKLTYDTTNMLNKGIYVGKCLILEDNDSLKCILDKEIDIFVMKNRDNKGRITNNQLFLIYNFRSVQPITENWDYSLELEKHDIEKGDFPKGSHLVGVKHITKQEVDFILKDWGVCHPSITI